MVLMSGDSCLSADISTTLLILNYLRAASRGEVPTLTGPTPFKYTFRCSTGFDVWSLRVLETSKFFDLDMIVGIVTTVCRSLLSRSRVKPITNLFSLHHYTLTRMSGITHDRLPILLVAFESPSSIELSILEGDTV